VAARNRVPASTLHPEALGLRYPAAGTMRKTHIFNTVRNLEELIRQLRAKRERSASDPKEVWTERDEEALAAAEKAVAPIKHVASETKRTP
jgi:hypothetical protein